MQKNNKYIYVQIDGIFMAIISYIFLLYFSRREPKNGIHMIFSFFLYIFMSVDIFSHISLRNHHLSSQFLHTFSCIFKRIYNISSSSSQCAYKKTFKIAMTFLQATYNSVLSMSIRYVCV